MLLLLDTLVHSHLHSQMVINFVHQEQYLIYWCAAVLNQVVRLVAGGELKRIVEVLSQISSRQD